MNKEGIFVKTDAFLFQLIKREKYRRRNDLTTYFLGIGGSTNEDPNPFIEAFHECERQISRKTSGLVHHLLPVASGEMLQGLVEGANTVSGEHQFTAVYTGDPLGKHRMEWKWKKTSNVEILHPAGSGEEVEKTINSFYQATSIRLDPIHTGRAVHQWMHELPKSLPTVLWITNPYIFG
ncbi:hypothetical protein [Alkalicoccus saliphilus]|uniref:Uncharacterized protein n=1 Tax=Alkalicoccus saliphilus TaxID=200989 RepID=A0A2T4U6Q4_9BACI|nr:hypothetical protein [Alkalicoccus saliphilus]PTL39071.1 hypothetical protein C6Y45_07770 [Alkalicoccus saliphilus]